MSLTEKDYLKKIIECLILILIIFLFGVFIQKIFIPIFFSSLDYGNGLIKDRDWIMFHENAISLLKEYPTISYENILAIIRYEQFSSLLYFLYFFISPSPVSYVFISSIMFGVSIFFLSNAFFVFSLREKIIFYFIMIFFPTNIMMYSQIHKDVFTFFSLVIFLSIPFWTKKKYQFLLFFFSIIISWIAREYQILIFLLGFSVYYLLLYFFNIIHIKKFIFYMMLIIGGFFFSNALSMVKNNQSAVKKNQYHIEIIEPKIINPNWKNSEYLPSFGNKLLKRVSSGRYGMNLLSKKNDSTIDKKDLNNATDILHYIPKAIINTLFKPLPIPDFQRSIEKIVSYVEMNFIYVLYVLSFVSICFYKIKNRIVYIILFTIILLLIPLGLVFSNLGTLYRMRQPYMNIIIFLCFYIINGHFRKN